MSARLRSDAVDNASIDIADPALLAELAHELRNPLAPLANCLEVVELARRRRVDCSRALALMKRQIARLALLADELSDAARAGRGQITLKREPVSVEEIARRAVEASVREPRPSVRMTGAETVLNADAVRLPRVLTMLLDQAVPDASHRTTLCARVDGGEVELRVEIERELPTRVADPFADGATPRARVSRSVIEHVVRLHGGSVATAANGFVVRLPIDPA